MSTSALISFSDVGGCYYVYQHWDGIPSVINANIEKAKALAWELPRFEANEFAAAYVAAVKDHKGDIRLVMNTNWQDEDVDYYYLVTCEEGILKIEILGG